MKLLSIGNSFSQDAQEWLHKIAVANGVDLETTNLMIGGCSLETHWHHMTDGEAAYYLERNGEDVQQMITLPDALAMDEWDVITVQQVSSHSGRPQTFFPYLQELVAFVREKCPKAKIYYHQTWAYEDGSERIKNAGYEGAEAMFNLIRSAYAKAKVRIGADGMIPCGEVMYTIWKNGVERVHRDGFHLALGVGRYAAALTWYAVLTGNSIDENAFNDFDEPISESERKIVIQTINEVLKRDCYD